MEPTPRFIFGMLRPELVFACSTGTKNLLWLSAGPRINNWSLRALLIGMFAFGTSPQVSVFVVLANHRSYVRSVAFSQSRERLLSGSGDGGVRLWELATGKMLQQFQGHRDGVYHAVFDPSQTRVLSGGRDRTIRLWEISTGRCLQLIDADGSPCAVSRMASGPTPIPFMRGRYPALGLGEWRMPTAL